MTLLTNWNTKFWSTTFFEQLNFGRDVRNNGFSVRTPHMFVPSELILHGLRTQRTVIIKTSSLKKMKIRV